MPRRAEYIDRIDAAIDQFRGADAPYVDRAAVQAAFGVSKWTALRILERIGARPVRRVGDVYLFRPADLVAGLERLRDGETVEAGRRRRVRAALEPAAEVGRLRSVVIAPPGPESDRLRAARELPAGVRFESGANQGEPARLVVEFGRAADFLTRLSAVVYALRNDFDGLMGKLSEALRIEESKDESTHQNAESCGGG